MNLGLAAVLLTLDVVGISRSEVICLWIFLACVFNFGGVYLLTPRNA